MNVRISIIPFFEFLDACGLFSTTYIVDIRMTKMKTRYLTESTRVLWVVSDQHAPDPSSDTMYQSLIHDVSLSGKMDIQVIYVGKSTSMSTYRTWDIKHYAWTDVNQFNLCESSVSADVFSSWAASVFNKPWTPMNMSVHQQIIALSHYLRCAMIVSYEMIPTTELANCHSCLGTIQWVTHTDWAMSVIPHVMVFHYAKTPNGGLLFNKKCRSHEMKRAYHHNEKTMECTFQNYSNRFTLYQGKHWIDISDCVNQALDDPLMQYVLLMTGQYYIREWNPVLYHHFVNDEKTCGIITNEHNYTIALMIPIPLLETIKDSILALLELYEQHTSPSFGGVPYPEYAMEHIRHIATQHVGTANIIDMSPFMATKYEAYPYKTKRAPSPFPKGSLPSPVHLQLSNSSFSTFHNSIHSTPGNRIKEAQSVLPRSTESTRLTSSLFKTLEKLTAHKLMTKHTRKYAQLYTLSQCCVSHQNGIHTYQTRFVESKKDITSFSLSWYPCSFRRSFPEVCVLYIRPEYMEESPIYYQYLFYFTILPLSLYMHRMFDCPVVCPGTSSMIRDLPEQTKGMYDDIPWITIQQQEDHIFANKVHVICASSCVQYDVCPTIYCPSPMKQMTPLLSAESSLVPIPLVIHANAITLPKTHMNVRLLDIKSCSFDTLWNEMKISSHIIVTTKSIDTVPQLVYMASSQHHRITLYVDAMNMNAYICFYHRMEVIDTKHITIVPSFQQSEQEQVDEWCSQL